MARGLGLKMDISPQYLHSGSAREPPVPKPQQAPKGSGSQTRLGVKQQPRSVQQNQGPTLKTISLQHTADIELERANEKANAVLAAKTPNDQRQRENGHQQMTPLALPQSRTLKQNGQVSRNQAGMRVRSEYQQASGPIKPDKHYSDG